MTHLFLKICQAFEAKKQLFINAGLEPVTHIDRYRGQPLNPEQFEYYPLPAIFIDWRISWVKSGKNYDGDLSLDFHVITHAASDASNIATSSFEGLKNITYHALIRAILDNLESQNTGKLLREGENPVEAGAVNYQMMRYRCNYSDPGFYENEYAEAFIKTLKINGKLVTKTTKGRQKG